MIYGDPNSPSIVEAVGSAGERISPVRHDLKVLFSGLYARFRTLSRIPKVRRMQVALGDN